MRIGITTLILSFLILLSSTTNLFIKSFSMREIKKASIEKSEENKGYAPRKLKQKNEFDTYIILYFKNICIYSRGFINNYRKSISYLIQRPNNNKLKPDRSLIITKSYGIEIHFNNPVRNLEYFFSTTYDRNMEYLVSIDFSHFDSSLVTNTRSLFSGCSSLE